MLMISLKGRHETVPRMKVTAGIKAEMEAAIQVTRKERFQIVPSL